MSKQNFIKIEYSSEKVWTRTSPEPKKRGDRSKTKNKTLEVKPTKSKDVKMAFIIKKSVPHIERVKADGYTPPDERSKKCRIVKSTIESRNLRVNDWPDEEEEDYMPKTYHQCISVKRTRSACKLARVNMKSEKTSSFLTFAKAIRNSISSYNLIDGENDSFDMVDSPSANFTKERTRIEQITYSNPRKSCSISKQAVYGQGRRTNTRIETRGVCKSKTEETPTYLMFFKNFQEEQKTKKQPKPKPLEDQKSKMRLMKPISKRASMVTTRLYNSKGCTKHSAIPVKKVDKPKPDKPKPSVSVLKTTKAKKPAEEPDPGVRKPEKLIKYDPPFMEPSITKYVDEILNDDNALKSICSWLLTGDTESEGVNKKKSEMKAICEMKRGSKLIIHQEDEEEDAPVALKPEVKSPLLNLYLENRKCCRREVIESLKKDHQRRMKKARKVASQGKVKQDLGKCNKMVKLRRHMSDPHTQRGFIWRKIEAYQQCSNDLSITSVTSSMRHLNAEDADDFVFWEALPPQAGSYWEISLYKSKKPWSVLSFSVFKNNRASNTPGLILENFRNGRLLERRASTTFESPMSLRQTTSFDVEPSIAQKNIDIMNWVGALNFYSSESKMRIPTEGTMRDVGEKLSDYAFYDEHLPESLQKYVPSARTLKKFKTKFTNEQEPDVLDINNTESPPEVPRMKKSELDERNTLSKTSVMKSLMNLNGPVGGQTRFVYMYTVSQTSRRPTAAQPGNHGKTSRGKDPGSAERAERLPPEKVIIGDEAKAIKQKPIAKEAKSKERFTSKSPEPKAEGSSRAPSARSSRHEIKQPPTPNKQGQASRSDSPIATPTEKISPDVIAHLRADNIRKTMIEYGKRVMKKGLIRSKKDTPQTSTATEEGGIVCRVEDLTRWGAITNLVLQNLGIFFILVFAISLVLFLSIPYHLLVIPF